jgi:hypothetical protein
MQFGPGTHATGFLGAGPIVVAPASVETEVNDEQQTSILMSHTMQRVDGFDHRGRRCIETPQTLEAI